MSEVFNCVNCGKQNILLDDDPPDVMCEFLDKNGKRHHLKVKEGSMAKTMANLPKNLPIQSQIIGAELHYDKKERAFLPDNELPPVPPKPDLTVGLY